MPSFRFKQFDIEQNNCAMKVGTDGVLLGSWVNVNDCNSILDVGTGTGLIALMLAQRNKTAIIEALEIDQAANDQAKLNFFNSPWKERLSSINLDFEKYNPNSTFDLIVTNPPYFQNSLKPNEETRKLARHSDHFFIQNWLEKTSSLLSPTGKLSIIIPTDNYSSFKKSYIQAGFFLSRLCNVHPTPTKLSKRVLLELVQNNSETKIIPEKLVIELNQRHQYSEEYKLLTKDFYLKF